MGADCSPPNMAMYGMFKWQKIAGVVTFGAIGTYELLLCANAYVDLKYITLDLYWSDEIERLYQRTNSISITLLLNYIIALALLICLWRKGTNKTNPSPIKIISVEKITLPFTFEKTYCRLGVFTENNGIERMEAYFVRNDKTAICYKNCLFYQVVIDDAKHDKYDNSEINTGTIINIRATTGLANYIVKLSDERLIVFEILPEGYGELYENFTIVLPSDDRYSEYLEDYNKGAELDY